MLRGTVCSEWSSVGFVVDDSDYPFVIELGGGWGVQRLTMSQWNEAIKAELAKFAEYRFKPDTEFVLVVFRNTTSTRQGSDDESSTESNGSFVAPCGVPEDSSEALYVALINAMAHEALELVQLEGKPHFDPHTDVGDYMLERTLTKWLEWKTGKTVLLE